MKCNYMLCIILIFSIIGCGEEPEGAAQQDPLQLDLEIPDGEVKAEFWHGIEKYQFSWLELGKNANDVITWQLDQLISIDFNKGGEITFRGLTKNDVMLVYGKTRIPETAINRLIGNVTIKVHQFIEE